MAEYETCNILSIEDMPVADMVNMSMIVCGAGLMFTIGILACIRILKA